MFIPGGNSCGDGREPFSSGTRSIGQFSGIDKLKKCLFTSSLQKPVSIIQH